MANLTAVDWSALPTPEDDGGADHLPGAAAPALALRSTGGGSVDLSALGGLLVLYVYPMTAEPGRPLPENWDNTPGARGCTPQSCAFRDHFAELREAGADHVFGLSTQTPDAQAEAVHRLHLPFALLSDESLAFADAMALPRFEAGGRTRLKRVTLIFEAGRVARCFYPVFPPDENAAAVASWLAGRR